MADLSTPEGAFRTAQSAIARDDWETFYSTLDPRDVRVLVRNGLGIILNFGLVNEAFQATCTESGFPLTPLLEAYRRGDGRQVRETIDSGLDSVADLPVFSALLERHTRQHSGSGSVARSLFQGEHLEDLEVEGSRAWATRFDSRGEVDPIGFTRRSEEWLIRLFARHRR